MNNHGAAFLREDPWRILRIMGEFVECFEIMSRLSPSVTVFGSARTPRNDPYYKLTVQFARKLAQHKIPVITGGGPGIMEAANKGAALGNGTSKEMSSRTCRCTFITSFPAKSVSPNTVLRSCSCREALGRWTNCLKFSR
jgi:hypothetical protein